MWHKNWDWYQKTGTIPFQSLEIIRVLLAPAAPSLHVRLKDDLKKLLPLTAYRQVETICQSILQEQQSFPQSIPAVFEATASKLGLPKALLVPDHLAARDIDFFSKIRRLFP